MTAKKKAPAKKRASKKAKPKRVAKKKAAAKARKPSAPKTGDVIERTFKGTKHTVTVTADGFTYKGTAYRSLTAIAKKITSYPSVSGPRFFGTDEAGKTNGGAK